MHRTKSIYTTSLYGTSVRHIGDGCGDSETHTQIIELLEKSAPTGAKNRRHSCPPDAIFQRFILGFNSKQCSTN